MNSFAQHHKGLITIFQNPITWEVRPNITISFIPMIIEQVKPLNARPDVSITLFNKAIYSSNKNKGNLKIRRINMVTYKIRNRWLWPSGSRGLCLRLVVRCRITGTSWRRELKWVCSKIASMGFAVEIWGFVNGGVCKDVVHGNPQGWQAQCDGGLHSN